MALSLLERLLEYYGISYEEYQNLNTFGVLRSYSSKKICRFILALLRHGYLEKKYDKSFLFDKRAPPGALLLIGRL